MNKLWEFYNRRWKILMLITIVALIVSGIFLVKNIIETGSPIKRDIELVGGKLITMEVGNVDINVIQNVLPNVNIRFVSGIKNTLLIEADVNADDKIIINKLNDIGVSGEYSVRTIGPSLGEVFWKQAQIAIIFAFILMSIVVFIIFRSFVPSIAVVICAVTDIAVSMFITSAMGITLSLSTLAAFLMLIGYSVDTDIVLTTEVMRSGDRDISKSIKIAMRTGVTMTLCALVALLAMYFISGSHVLQQMAIVLIVGLVVDLPATWLTNTGILRWYMERKERILKDINK